MLKDSDYRLAHSHETFMDGKPMGVRIYVANGDDKPSEQIERAAWNIGEQMFKAVWKEMAQNNEEIKVRAAKEKAEILALFGDRQIFVEEIPNGYCNDPCCCMLPWFIVTTPIGHIKIGWRKRVINIDWTNTTQKKKPHELFPNEDVTKGGPYDDGRYIHAWGYEKAKEYLDTLHK